MRSLLSDAYLVDLTTIYMKDKSGNIMKDSSGNPLSYIDYYNEYCTNIGDLILGLTEAAYPQLSNYTGQQLQQLQESDEVQSVVSTTIDNEQILQVVPINKHLTDDVSTQDIINLHAQKNNVQAQLATVNAISSNFQRDTILSYDILDPFNTKSLCFDVLATTLSLPTRTNACICPSPI